MLLSNHYKLITVTENMVRKYLHDAEGYNTLDYYKNGERT